MLDQGQPILNIMKHICQFCRKKLKENKGGANFYNFECTECNVYFRFLHNNTLISAHLSFPGEEKFIYIDYSIPRTTLCNNKMHAEFTIDRIFILSPREILNKLRTLSTLS